MTRIVFMQLTTFCFEGAESIIEDGFVNAFVPGISNFDHSGFVRRERPLRGKEPEKQAERGSEKGDSPRRHRGIDSGRVTQSWPAFPRRCDDNLHFRTMLCDSP